MAKNIKPPPKYYHSKRGTIQSAEPTRARREGSYEPCKLSSIETQRVPHSWLKAELRCKPGHPESMFPVPSQSPGRLFHSCHEALDPKNDGESSTYLGQPRKRQKILRTLNAELESRVPSQGLDPIYLLTPYLKSNYSRCHQCSPTTPQCSPFLCTLLRIPTAKTCVLLPEDFVWLPEPYQVQSVRQSIKSDPKMTNRGCWMTILAPSPLGWDNSVFNTVPQCSPVGFSSVAPGGPWLDNTPLTPAFPSLSYFIKINYLYSNPCLKLYFGEYLNQDHLWSARKTEAPKCVSFCCPLMVVVWIMKKIWVNLINRHLFSFWHLLVTLSNAEWDKKEKNNDTWSLP